MESVLGRYRNLVILVGVLFLQVLGLAVQVKRENNGTESTRLIRIWGVGAITPLERVLVWAQHGTGNIWHNYFYLRGVRAENRQLREQLEEMRLEQVRLSEDAAQAHRLQALLGFKEQYIARTVAAQVIGSSGSDISRMIYIDKGENAGLKRDMAVITAEGIVGKVLLVYPTVAQVLLINDQSSGVGAILEKSRLQGVLRGTTNGEVLLERVMADEQVSVGEKVLTSGGDQIFPKGLPVGTIAKVGNGKDLFLNIKVKPAANLSRLEEVLVLVEKQEREAMAEDNVRGRAADILAQRLPSVPDKPATDPNAPATSGTAGAAGTAASPAGSPQQKTGDASAIPVKPHSAAGPVTPEGTTTGATKTGNAPGTASAKPGVPQAKPANAQSPVSRPVSTQPKAQPPAETSQPQ